MNFVVITVKIAIAFGAVALIGYGLAWFDGDRKIKSSSSGRNSNYADRIGGRGRGNHPES
jgi:hypothetical protein